MSMTDPFPSKVNTLRVPSLRDIIFLLNKKKRDFLNKIVDIYLLTDELIPYSKDSHNKMLLFPEMNLTEYSLFLRFFFRETNLCKIYF